MDIMISKEVYVPAVELWFTTSRSGGPGGQHVNKVNSRVTLHFNVQHSSGLSSHQKRRIMAYLHTRVNKEGVLRLHSQKYKSQASNREDLVERFQTLLSLALKPQRPRVPTRISRSVKERRLLEKKRRGQVKRQRSQHEAEE